MGRQLLRKERRTSSDEVVAKHVASMQRRGLRPNTITLRKRVLRRLELFVSKSLLQVTVDDIRRYLDRHHDTGSRAAEATQIRSFYRWVVDEGYLRIDPTLRLESIRKRKYLPRPIGDEDLAKALTHAPERVRPMLWLAAYAGLRAHDLAQLRAENILLNRDPPIVFIEESKGGKPRTVPLAPLLVAQIRRHIPKEGWLFPHFDGRPGHITAQYVGKLCNDYMHSIGIDATLHQLRHAFVTKCYAVDRDLVVTQELAGHESIATTRLYTWTDPARAAEVVNRLLPVTADAPLL